MSICLRPHGDALAKMYGEYFPPEDVHLLLDKSKRYEVLCNDGKHYMVEIKEHDKHRTSGIAHFVMWPKKFDYKGSFKLLYITNLGTYSDGLNRNKNIYTEPKPEKLYWKDFPSFSAGGGEKKSVYMENTRYDDSFLAKPRLFKGSSRRKSVENEDESGSVGKIDEEDGINTVVTDGSSASSSHFNLYKSYESTNNPSPPYHHVIQKNKEEKEEEEESSSTTLKQQLKRKFHDSFHPMSNELHSNIINLTENHSVSQNDFVQNSSEEALMLEDCNKSVVLTVDDGINQQYKDLQSRLNDCNMEALKQLLRKYMLPIYLSDEKHEIIKRLLSYASRENKIFRFDVPSSAPIGATTNSVILSTEQPVVIDKDDLIGKADTSSTVPAADCAKGFGDSSIVSQNHVFYAEPNDEKITLEKVLAEAQLSSSVVSSMKFVTSSPTTEHSLHTTVSFTTDNGDSVSSVELPHWASKHITQLLMIRNQTDKTILALLQCAQNSSSSTSSQYNNDNNSLEKASI